MAPGGLTSKRAPEQRASIAGPLGASLFLAARRDDAIAVFSRAVEQLGGAHPGLRRELEVRQLHIALTQPSHYPLAVELARRPRAEPVPDDLTGRMLLACLAFHEACVCSRRDLSRRDLVLSLARQAQAGGLLVQRANGGGEFGGLAMALLAADEDEAARLLDASLAEAHKRGSGLGFAAAKVFGSRLALLQGRCRRPSPRHGKASRLARRGGSRLALPSPRLVAAS